MPNQTLGQGWGHRGGRATLERHPLVLGTGMVGIEVELEGTRDAYDFQSDYWEVKEDGSLRGGHEFVFRNPTGGRDLYNAAVELDTFLHNRNPDGNWRCSTHVHVDVRDMTGQQLKNLILIYTVLEKFLFRLSGMHRYKNNFCCSLGFAQQQLKVLMRSWTKTSTVGFSSEIVRGWDKYSALNLLPIRSFGSVEFRLSEATWRKGKLLLLANRFLAIKELAKTWDGTDEDLIEHLINSDIRDILHKGLPKEIDPGFRSDLMVGYKLAYDLVTFSKNRPIRATNQRNDKDVAESLYVKCIEMAGEFETIPYYHFVTSESPKISISKNVWEQMCEYLRNHRDVYLTSEMRDQLNADTLYWVLDAVDIDCRHAIRDEDQLDIYSAWVEENKNLEVWFD